MTDFAEPVAPVEMALPDVAPPKPVSSDWSGGSDWQRHGEGKAIRDERRGSIAAARAKVEGKYEPSTASRLRENRPSTATAYSAKVREERRGVIERAAAKVRERDEPGKSSSSTQFMTKQERLARETGSEAERRSVRGVVAKAAEKVGAVPTREETLAARAELRKAVETLRQRYPGKTASDFVKIAKDWDAAYKTDPVGTRERILEAYARVSPENTRDFVEPEKAKGARGSVRQAMRDQEDAADLAEFEKEFGSKLPAVLSELVRHDEALRRDPVGTSARLAANYNAPVTPRQEAEYVARQQAEQARQEQARIVHHGLAQIIERKLLPGLDDEKTLHAIADVLESKDFKRTGDRGKDLEKAHAIVMANQAKAPADDRGTKSISGAPSAPRAAREPTGVRGSINRAKAKA